MAEVKHSDGHVTHTRPYGGGASKGVHTPDESLNTHAERGVIEKHGPQIINNPKFKELVKEEERQISENISNTEGM